jgi:hypothetical protein
MPVALHAVKEFGVAFSLSLRSKGRSESQESISQAQNVTPREEDYYHGQDSH